MTSSELAIYEARRKPQAQSFNANAVELEGTLHGDIMAYCRSKCWPFGHSRMDKKTSDTLGWPDFCIMADRSRVFFIECKAKTKKLSQDQAELNCVASKNGHIIHVVRSFEQFLAIVEKL